MRSRSCPECQLATHGVSSLCLPAWLPRAQVLACPAEAEAILPWIKWFQSMIRWVQPIE